MITGALACSGATAPTRPGITLRLENVTVAAAMSAFANASGEPVVVDPAADRVAGCAQVTVIVPTPTPVPQVGALFGEMLSPHGFRLTHGDSGWMLTHEGPLPAGCGEPPPSFAIPALPPSDGAPDDDVAADPSAGIAEGTISRASLNAWLADEDDVLSSARVIPYEENGAVVGMRLYGIRRTSRLGLLGFQNGDTVRSVNDVPVTDPERLLEAYSRIRDASEIRVLLTRRGETFVHTIRVTEP